MIECHTLPWFYYADYKLEYFVLGDDFSAFNELANELLIDGLLKEENIHSLRNVACLHYKEESIREQWESAFQQILNKLSVRSREGRPTDLVCIIIIIIN